MDDIIFTCIRWFLGAILMVAGLAKLVNGRPTHRELELVGVGHHIANRSITIVLSLFELFMAVLFFTGKSPDYTILLSLTFFSLMTAHLLYTRFVLGNSSGCGCFGSFGPNHGRDQDLGRNAILIIAVIVLAIERHQSGLAVSTNAFIGELDLSMLVGDDIVANTTIPTGLYLSFLMLRSLYQFLGER